MADKPKDSKPVRKPAHGMTTENTPALVGTQRMGRPTLDRMHRPSRNRQR